MIFKKYSPILLSIGIGFAAQACSDDDNDKPSLETASIQNPGSENSTGLADDMSVEKQFSTLLSAIDTAGLSEVIASGQFTIFAPTNEAFAKIPKDTLEGLLKDKEALTDILLYHTVPGQLKASDVLDLDSIETANAKKLVVEIMDGDVFISNAKILQTDILSDDDIFHAIDTVLVPESNNSEPSIIDIAKESGSFQTLLIAATEAGLLDILSSEGPFTLFAPTDRAFSKIPEDTLNALIADKEALTKVLLNHVVPGKLDASKVLEQTILKTANNLELQISLRDGIPYVGDSKIIATDVMASNGVIHVVDSVILP